MNDIYSKMVKHLVQNIIDKAVEIATSCPICCQEQINAPKCFECNNAFGISCYKQVFKCPFCRTPKLRLACFQYSYHNCDYCEECKILSTIPKIVSGGSRKMQRDFLQSAFLTLEQMCNMKKFNQEIFLNIIEKFNCAFRNAMQSCRFNDILLQLIRIYNQICKKHGIKRLRSGKYQPRFSDINLALDYHEVFIAILQQDLTLLPACLVNSMPKSMMILFLESLLDLQDNVALSKKIQNKSLLEMEYYLGVLCGVSCPKPKCKITDNIACYIHNTLSDYYDSIKYDSESDMSTSSDLSSYIQI